MKASRAGLMRDATKEAQLREEAKERKETMQGREAEQEVYNKAAREEGAKAEALNDRLRGAFFQVQTGATNAAEELASAARELGEGDVYWDVDEASDAFAESAQASRPRA